MIDECRNQNTTYKKILSKTLLVDERELLLRQAREWGGQIFFDFWRDFQIFRVIYRIPEIQSS